jgi:hypothetical protein
MDNNDPQPARREPRGSTSPLGALFPDVPIDAERQVFWLSLLVGAIVFSGLMGWGPHGEWLSGVSTPSSEAVTTSAVPSVSRGASRSVDSTTSVTVVPNVVPPAEPASVVPTTEVPAPTVSPTTVSPTTVSLTTVSSTAVLDVAGSTESGDLGDEVVIRSTVPNGSSDDVVGTDLGTDNVVVRNEPGSTVP